MRFPQASSKTAVDRTHWRGRLKEPDAEGSEPIELGLDIVDGAGFVRDAVLHQRLPERLRSGMGTGLEEELDAVGCIGRDDGQLAVLAGGQIGLLHKAHFYALWRAWASH